MSDQDSKGSQMTTRRQAGIGSFFQARKRRFNSEENTADVKEKIGGDTGNDGSKKKRAEKVVFRAPNAQQIRARRDRVRTLFAKSMARTARLDERYEPLVFGSSYAGDMTLGPVGTSRQKLTPLQTSCENHGVSLSSARMRFGGRGYALDDATVTSGNGILASLGLALDFRASSVSRPRTAGASNEEGAATLSRPKPPPAPPKSKAESAALNRALESLRVRQAAEVSTLAKEHSARMVSMMAKAGVEKSELSSVVDRDLNHMKWLKRIHRVQLKALRTASGADQKIPSNATEKSESGDNCDLSIGQQDKDDSDDENEFDAPGGIDEDLGDDAMVPGDGSSNADEIARVQDLLNRHSHNAAGKNTNGIEKETEKETVVKIEKETTAAEKGTATTSTTQSDSATKGIADHAEARRVKLEMLDRCVAGQTHSLALAPKTEPNQNPIASSNNTANNNSSNNNSNDEDDNENDEIGPGVPGRAVFHVPVRTADSNGNVFENGDNSNPLPLCVRHHGHWLTIDEMEVVVANGLRPTEEKDEGGRLAWRRPDEGDKALDYFGGNAWRDVSRNLPKPQGGGNNNSNNKNNSNGDDDDDDDGDGDGAGSDGDKEITSVMTPEDCARHAFTMGVVHYPHVFYPPLWRKSVIVKESLMRMLMHEPFANGMANRLAGTEGKIDFLRRKESHKLTGPASRGQGFTPVTGVYPIESLLDDALADRSAMAKACAFFPHAANREPFSDHKTAVKYLNKIVGYRMAPGWTPPSVESIKASYEAGKARSSDTWYDDFHALVLSYMTIDPRVPGCPDAGDELHLFMSLLATSSPNSSVAANIASALLNYRSVSQDSRPRCGSYPNRLLLNYLAGALGSATGSKVRAFLCNLTDPHDPAVTIDTHMEKVILGRGGNTLTRVEYAVMEDFVRTLAPLVGEPSPKRLQSAVWCTVAGQVSFHTEMMTHAVIKEFRVIPTSEEIAAYPTGDPRRAYAQAILDADRATVISIARSVLRAKLLEAGYLSIADTMAAQSTENVSLIVIVPMRKMTGSSVQSRLSMRRQFTKRRPGHETEVKKESGGGGGGDAGKKSNGDGSSSSSQGSQETQILSSGSSQLSSISSSSSSSSSSAISSPKLAVAKETSSMSPAAGKRARRDAFERWEEGMAKLAMERLSKEGVETVPDWSDELWADRDMRALDAWLSPTAEGVGADFYDLDMHVEADPYFGTDKYFGGSVKTLPGILPAGGFVTALHAAIMDHNSNNSNDNNESTE